MGVDTKLRVMMETYNTENDKVAVTGPYHKPDIEFWVERCNAEAKLTVLKRDIRVLTEEEELLYTGDKSYRKHLRYTPII